MPNERFRKRLRFSLRATMLVILWAAIWLGSQVNQAREQRDALDAVRKYGGWVSFDYEFVNGTRAAGRQPWGSRWIRDRIGDEYFQKVTEVNLIYDASSGRRIENANMDTCDDLLRKIRKLPGVKKLLLIKKQATDEGMSSIGKMADLEELTIWNAYFVTDAGVSQLAHLQNLKARPNHLFKPQR